MVNTKGYRRGTRYLFSRDFRKHGEYLGTSLIEMIYPVFYLRRATPFNLLEDLQSWGYS